MNQFTLPEAGSGAAPTPGHAEPPPQQTGPHAGAGTTAPAASRRWLTRRRAVVAGVAALAAAAGLLAWLLWPLYGPPALVLKTPAPVPATSRDEIIVDVTVTSLPDGVYPAASLAVAFDPTKLEFTGTRQGTMTTLNGANPQPAIPVWSADPEYANSQGRVTTMYLDTTAGSFGYTAAGHSSGDRDTLLRLAFRLRDSVQPGDDLHLTVVDAVLAATDNATSGSSLGTADRSLRAYPARILVQP